MVAPRRVIALPTDAEQRQRLLAISRSRIEPTGRVERARIILAYLQDPSAYAVARTVGVTQQTVTRCLERAAELGVIEALDDRPRAGRDPVITAEAKTWLVALACRKARELGYPHELWTTRLLAATARHQPDRDARSRVQAPRHPDPDGRDRSAHWSRPCPGQGTPPQSRIHRVSQPPRRRLPRRHRNRGHSRQPFRPCLARDDKLARGAADWPLYLHVHADAWVMAQSHRGLLLQAGAFGAAPHPRQLQTRTQGTPDGLHR